MYFNKKILKQKLVNILRWQGTPPTFVEII